MKSKGHVWGKLTGEKVSLRDFARIFWYLLALGEIRRRFMIALVLLFIALLYNVVPPLIVGAIVNFFTQYHSGEDLTEFYWLVILLGVSSTMVAIFRLTVKNRISRMKNKTVYSIRTKAFASLLSQSILEGAQESTGAKAQRIQNGTDAFAVFIQLTSNNILPVLASLSGILGVFFFLKGSYVVFFLFYILLFFGLIRMFTRNITKLNTERNKALEQASGAYIEGLHNIGTLKAAGSENAFHGRIAEREAVTQHFGDRISRTSNDMWKLFQAMNGLGGAIFLFLVGMDVVRGDLNIGQIVVFVTYFQQLTTLASQTLDSYADLLQAQAGVVRLQGVFGVLEKSKIHQVSFPQDWKSLSIKNGFFDYPEGPGLQDIELAIKRGEKIGIVGKTGSGKSTLVKILLGLLPLRSGKYLIDQTDFHLLEKEAIFQYMSIVPQEVEMFNMSLRENITLYREVSETALEKALETAQLTEVIENLPDGIDTLIGEKGYKLSGGERQRVGIARALCQNTDIIILDEATSSLDAHTEKSFYDALEKNYPAKTIIAIAHRIHTLENTHRIYTLGEGRIIREGTHADL